MDAIEDLSPEEITTLSLHDVRYLLESPSLLESGTWSSDGEIRAQGLQEALLDALSNSSWTYQAPLPLRVGRYAESLLQRITDLETNAFQRLATNLQIFEDRATIGEVDLMTSHPDGHLHIELAVKLYLGLPQYSGSLDGWVGPNPRDTLGKKFRHLRDKQLPLSSLEVTRKALGLKTAEPIAQHAWVKGYLFHHHGLPMELPDLVNPHHTHGWWTLDSDDWQPSASRDTEYCIPPKPFWIHTIPEGTPRYTDWNELLKAAAPQIEQRLTAHVLEVEKGTEIIVSRGFIASAPWFDAAKTLTESLLP